MVFLKSFIAAISIFFMVTPNLCAEQPEKIVDTIDGSIKTRKQTQKRPETGKARKSVKKVGIINSKTHRRQCKLRLITFKKLLTVRRLI